MVDLSPQDPQAPATNDLLRRVVGYGLGALAAAGLVWAAAYTRPADADTLVGNASIQLQLAYGMPAVDKEGDSLTARDAMLQDVATSLQLAEKQEPGRLDTAELAAFLRELRGDFSGAAEAYRALQDQVESGNTTWFESASDRKIYETAVFQEARNLIRAEQQEAALQTLGRRTARLSKDLQDRAAVMRAEILFELGRDADARGEMVPLIEGAANRPMPSVWAGRALAAEGDVNLAEKAFRAASHAAEGAFQLARLKLDQGEVDTAIELLASACTGFPDRLPTLLRRDRDHWVELAGAGPIEQLLETSGDPASPVR